MASKLDGLHPEFRRRVEALLADPEARRAGLYVVSGFRSVARQRMLWLRALARYGSAAKARKWVAPPGHSNHGPRVAGYGIAVDFGIPGVRAASGQWPASKQLLMRRLGARYGLHQPMAWEDWHYEPVEGERIKGAVAFAPADPVEPATPAGPNQEDAELNSEEAARLKNIEAAVARMEAKLGNEVQPALRETNAVVKETNDRTKRFGLDFGRIKRFFKIPDNA